MAAADPCLNIKIDPQNLQIQTHTVEKLLEPLIIQVTTLMNCPQNPSGKRKGCSKRARVILASVEEATWNLLDKGEKIAKEAPVLMEELNAALHEVRKESSPVVALKTWLTTHPPPNDWDLWLILGLAVFTAVMHGLLAFCTNDLCVFTRLPVVE